MEKENQKELPTIRDVARRAGVSTASVSRVLNRRDSITEDVYNRVNNAIQELGYRPQRNRSKAPQPSPWLFVLTEKIDEPFFLEVIGGIQEQAETEGFIPSILSISSNNHSRLAEILEQLKSQPAIGILAAGVYLKPEDWIRYQEEVGVPVVMINTPVNHAGIASVMVNFETAAAQAARHLLSLNHTRIAFMGDYENQFALAELEGVKRALKSRGMDYPEEYHFSISHTPEGASQGISKMMILPEEKRPTAILAFDDIVAIQLLNALRYYKLRVPEDISLIGFDNIAMAGHSNPPLTTVDIPKRRIGRLMVKLIKDLIDNPKDILGTTIIEGSLIVRGSTGRAKSEKLAG